ncbi:MAG: hypothetical protein J0H94_10085 [Rhizobiales bacterium]|nr:hypothetical protein [Hyphomicrobiales bacterium]
MASNENRPGGLPAGTGSADDIIRAVRDDLAAMDERVFGNHGAPSFDQHLAELRRAVNGLLGPSRG